MRLLIFLIITAMLCPAMAEDKKSDEIVLLDLSVNVEFLSENDVQQLRQFLTELKKSSPHVSMRISRGRAKYVSPRQTKSVRGN